MFFNNVGAKRKTVENSTRQISFWRPSVAGVEVNDTTAFTYSAFYSCVRIISETVAYLPWRVLVQGTKKQYAQDNSLDTILHTRPNSEMDAFTFKELLLQHLLAWGNSYSEIERNRRGEVVGLWPIDPSCVYPDRDSKGKLFYQVQTDYNGMIDFAPKDIFSLRGPSRDGIVGYSVIQLAKESISLGLAAESFGAAFFGNGAIPGSVITNDGATKIDSTGVSNLLDTFNRKNKGAKNAMKTNYLEPGMDIKTIGVPPVDAQFLESRKFQLSEMARWFRIPPHKIGDLERSTHSNIEAQNIEFVTDAVIPWVSRMENRANFSLVRDPSMNYTKMNVLGLLRGDSKARAEYYKTLANLGVLSIDEIREKEDMDFLEKDGDLRLVPMNMTTPERAKSGELTQNKAVAKSIFEENAARMVKIETSRVKKLAEKNDLGGIAKFYVEFGASLANSFYNTSALVCSEEQKRTTELKRFFGKYIENSADELQNAIESGQTNGLFCAWDARKSQNMARDLMEVLSNV